MSMQIRRASVTASALGASSPVPLTDVRMSAFAQNPSQLLPSVLATVSAGASLTYNVEVTGDDITAPGYAPANGNWNVFDGMGGLVASANGTLQAVVTAFRINITSYASGSVTLTIVSV